MDNVHARGVQVPLHQQGKNLKVPNYRPNENFSQKVSEDDFDSVIHYLPFVPGIYECFKSLNQLGGELIVISDANTYFIRSFLKHHNVSMVNNNPTTLSKKVHSQVLSFFDEVYSNPAEFDDQGQLVINPYHFNAFCSLSSPNLCKGQVLEEHRQRSEERRRKE